MKCSRVVILGNRDRALRKHRPRVKARIHLHDRNAALAIACEDSALNRCGAPPARKQGGMNVEGSQRCTVEHHLRQDQAVRRNHQQFRTDADDSTQACGVLQRRGLKYVNFLLESQTLDGALRRPHTASCGSIRLGQHERYFVASTQESSKRALSEFRGACESQTHWRVLTNLAAAAPASVSRAPPPSSLSALPELLGQSCANALLLELRKVLDEDLTLQVVHLVLDAYRQQTLRL